MTPGKAADVIMQLESRIARLEEHVNGVLCPPRDPDACNACRGHRVAAAESARWARERAKSAERKAEAEQAERDYWVANPPEAALELTYGRPTGAFSSEESIPIDAETAAWLDARGGGTGQNFRGESVLVPLEMCAGGRLTVRADHFARRCQLDDRLRAAVESGLIKTEPAHPEDAKQLAAALRGRLR